MQQQEQDQRQGYGGRWKRWLLIYLGAAVVIYAIVYFAFFYHSGGYGGGGGGGGGTGGGGYWVLALLGGWLPDTVRRAGR
jgi:hypothetical protein